MRHSDYLIFIKHQIVDLNTTTCTIFKQGFIFFQHIPAIIGHDGDLLFCLSEEAPKIMTFRGKAGKIRILFFHDLARAPNTDAGGGDNASGAYESHENVRQKPRHRVCAGLGGEGGGGGKRRQRQRKGQCACAFQKFSFHIISPACVFLRIRYI